MRKIRTLVVDDEPLARARILKLLENFEYITVIGECKNGREALSQIKTYKPDLVFLDIQMPDLTGFDVLESQAIDPLPFIIFVTAYDHYAIKAFNVHAVDYLLKPYDDERFIQALTHAKEQILLKDASLLHKKMIRILDEYKHQQSDELTAIEVKEKGMTKLVNVNDIYWIEAEGNYLKIHLENNRHLIRKTLQNIENQLDNRMFLRIHRSMLVNQLYIESVKYKGNNQYSFNMKNGGKLMSSRSYKEDVTRYLDSDS
jgi:two-component system LytT family response regulator